MFMPNGAAAAGASDVAISGAGDAGGAGISSSSLGGETDGERVDELECASELRPPSSAWCCFSATATMEAFAARRGLTFFFAWIRLVVMRSGGAAGAMAWFYEFGVSMQFLNEIPQL
jgi:hypothetical protein